MDKLYAFSLIGGFLFSLLLFLSGGRIRMIRIPRMRWLRLPRLRSLSRISRGREHTAAMPLLSGMFLTIFGLSGLMSRSLTIALICGTSLSIAIAWAASRFLAVTATELQGNLMCGTIGHVSLAIPEKGVGRVAYIADGRRLTIPARAHHGDAIAKGERVVVISLEDRIAVVEKL